MKTLQKLGLFFYFFMPLVKLAPPNQQHSALFYDHGLAPLEDPILKQGNEGILFEEDYEDKPQDAVIYKVV